MKTIIIGKYENDAAILRLDDDGNFAKPQPYVYAINYDIKTNTWQHGEYFSSLETLGLYILKRFSTDNIITKLCNAILHTEILAAKILSINDIQNKFENLNNEHHFKTDFDKIKFTPEDFKELEKTTAEDNNLLNSIIMNKINSINDE